MLTFECSYHWIKSKKPAINLNLIEVGTIAIKYTKLYYAVENVFCCANKTSWVKDSAISIEVYEMYLIRIMYVELYLVLANIRIHIFYRTCRTYSKLVCTNILYPRYSNRLGQVNKTLTHARPTINPPPLANRKIPHAESLQTVYVYRQYVQAPVLSQSTSPPGGECTHYICSCNYLTRIICSAVTRKTFVFLEKNRKRNCFYRIFVKPALILPVRKTNLATKYVLKKCVSYIPLQIPVRYTISKMCEPGEESQPSIVMSVGEYLRLICIALVICTLFNVIDYMRYICPTAATGIQLLWYHFSICRKCYLLLSPHSYKFSPHSYKFALCILYKLAFCILSYRCDGSYRYGE
jgi:hypothetical protein